MTYSTDTQSCNSFNEAIPIIAESRTYPPTFCPKMSNTRTTDRTDPNVRPQGRNDTPEDEGSSASDTDDAVNPGKKNHLPPHRGPSLKNGLPQVGVKIRVRSLQALSLWVHCKHINVTGRKDWYGPGMNNLLSITLLLPHGTPTLEHSGGFL